MKDRFRRNAGVSILELMITLIILSILSVSVYSYYAKTVEDARVTRAKMDMHQIKEEIKKYAIKAGHYPDNIKQLMGNFHIPKSPYGNAYEMDVTRGEVILNYDEHGARKTMRVRYRPED